jgi:Tfp pilus assembly protein PilX
MTGLRHRVRGEEGMAMVVAIAVLTLTLTFSALTATNADQRSKTSGQDRDAKAALAAAEAGVATAMHRLRTTALQPTDCLTDRAAAPLANGQCPQQTEPVGTNAQYSYVVTRSLSAVAETCVSLPGAPAPPAGSTERCITSLGTANGVTRKVQMRVQAPIALPSHWAGLVATDRVEINNSIVMYPCGTSEVPAGTVGSNGSIKLNNSVELAHGDCATRQWNVAYPGGTSVTIGNSITPAAPTQSVRPSPWVIPAVDFGPSQTTNSNGSIATFARSGVTYTSASRSLTIDKDGYLELRAGVYNFCSMDLAEGAQLYGRLGEQVQIYLDSPTRPGSGCTAGGELHLNNNNWFGWPKGKDRVADAAELRQRAKELTLYVYGGSSGLDVHFNNSIHAAALIHGPTSRVKLNNSVDMFGAIATAEIDLVNSVWFQRPDGLSSGASSTGRAYGRQAWGQCRSVMSAADPEAGC